MNIALKYRPSSFKDLIGQEVLVRILKNAITLNKVHHSILLSGSSGIGKTTTARIIALCLNCSLGPTFEPCGSCESCLAIKNSSHPDVIEIDAASHTSVEDIKVILGDIRYLPISSKFKVFIIDEVHMLSTNAFNALLKTLEEPPSMVKFIFATTEIKKIPTTVISRCQRFDLQHIPAAKITKRLSYIAQKENFLIENQALELIAYHSGDSMRNALLLMNQVLLYNKDSDTLISTKDVVEVLCLVNRGTLCDLLEIILCNDLKGTFLLFDRIMMETSNSINIFEGLLQIIHLVCRYLITGEIDNSLNRREQSKVKKLSMKRSLIFFSRLWRILLKGVQDVRTSICGDIAAEMILVNLCYLSDLPSPEQVVRRFLRKNKTQQKSASSIESMQQKNYDFDKILQLLRQNNQICLYKQLYDNLELVDCRPGYLKLRAISRLRSGFSADLKGFLDQKTQMEWTIVIDECPVDQEMMSSHSSHIPVVETVLNTFKGARIIGIEDKE